MKRHALFVGVNTYDDPAIRPLRFSVPDASVLADRFGRLGFETRLLPDPTGPELLSAVETSVAGLGPGDVFLFFFAGHGFTAQDGAHLLFCKNDRKRLLRANSAGVRVDALEVLTDVGGFHRAFLLDSCRTDCFAGVDARGDETRDLDFVAMPKPLAGAGSFYLLRSCDKFRPALEMSGLGHGLFTQGLLEAMDACDPALARCGDEFAGAIRVRMDALSRRECVTSRQCPVAQINGPAFSLFDEGFFTSAQAIGAQKPSPATTATVAAPVYVTCPVCGRWNKKTDTFKCRECGRDDLCLEHRDPKTFLCSDCAAKKARDEAERRAREEAECLGLERRRLLSLLRLRAEHVAREDVARKSTDTERKDENGSWGKVSFYEKILVLCADERKEANWAEFHVGEGIPRAKLVKFIAAAIGRGADVNGVLSGKAIAFCDCTLWSAENGFLLTDKGIAVSGNWDAKTSVGQITWEEFARQEKCCFAEGSNSEILLCRRNGDAVFANVGGCGRDSGSVLKFFERLRIAAGGVAGKQTTLFRAVVHAFSNVRSSCFWIGNAIPGKKRMNAASSMRISEQSIFALYDDTFFGGARDGFVVAADGIHFKNLGYPPVHIPWAGVVNISYAPNKLVIANNEISAVDSCLSIEAKREVQKGLERLCALFATGQLPDSIRQ